MKQYTFIFFSLLNSLCLEAQNFRMPVADKSKEIPMKPLIVEGELSGISDGTPVALAFRVKRTNGWDTANNTLVDTIRNGKFHIEKKFIYKDFYENDDNVEYIVNTEGKSTFVYAYPGSTIKVSGTPSIRMDVTTWKVESNHPLQKEFYDYVAYEQESLSPIRKEIQAAYEEDDVDDALIGKLERKRDSINVVSMLDYMKDRECNSVFAMYLFRIAFAANRLGSESLKDRIRHLLWSKVPTDYEDQNVMDARGFVSKSTPLKTGSQMRDFILYDRKGKEHKLTQFKGKYTVIEFTSKFCGPCLQAMPILDGYYKRHKDKVEIIAISVDPENIWMEEKNNVSYHEWNDHKGGGEIASFYGSKGTPCFVIIDPEGNVLNISHGTASFFKNMLTYVSDAEVASKLK